MKWSVNSAAKEFGVDRRTLNRALEESGHSVGKGATFHTQVIASAIYGDLERERTLETIERRKLLEKENAEADKSLVRVQELQRILGEVLLPIRQKLLGLPSECATSCNPTDPQLSKTVLDAWMQAALASCHEALAERFKKR